MKKLRWLVSLLAILAALIWLLRSNLPPVSKYLLPLIFTCFLALYRILRGPTAADRSVATDILGIVVIGVCAILAIFTGKNWYLDIAIAWALQSFIGVLALAKYLEGRDFDD
jgi:multicomponent Na+:H+ antiporter subunit F